ncbi:ABC transporter permease [Xanthomonas massiliensis]|uniref:ABC transporter permease n=1 Tax=Xanthomonas massiliensis TaxID=1720302 RepID=UPI000824865B|nr:ABC transporter permease [Xanthomonas massiliensis]
MSIFPTLLTVMGKELLDLSRDRRTLLLSLLLGPLLYPVLILGMGVLSQSKARAQIDRPLDVAVIGREHAPNLVAFLAAKGLVAKAPPADVTAAIRNQDIDVALRIDPGFGADWQAGRPALVEILRDTTRRDSEIPARRIETALAGYAQQVGALRLVARGIDAQVARPLAVVTQDQATAEARRGLLLSLFLPVMLIITSFIGGSALILDATAGERERQSLEPLLATPAPRAAIVSGKIAAACLIGFVTLLLTLLAFKLSAQLPLSGVGGQLDVSFAAMAQMLFVLLPMLFIGTALLTFLAAGAKSMKEAQSHITWLILLPMLPSYALMAYPLRTQLWQFAVPFLGQNQMLLKLVRHEPIPGAVWAVYLVAGFGLAVLLWWAAVRRYGQERLAISG